MQQNNKENFLIELNRLKNDIKNSTDLPNVRINVFDDSNIENLAYSDLSRREVRININLIDIPIEKLRPLIVHELLHFKFHDELGITQAMVFERGKVFREALKKYDGAIAGKLIDGKLYYIKAKERT